MWQCFRGQSEDVSWSALDPLHSQKPSCMLIDVTCSSPHGKQMISCIPLTRRKSSFVAVLFSYKPGASSHCHDWRSRLLSSLGCRGCVSALFGLVSSLLFLVFVLSSRGSVCLCPRCVEHLLQSDAWNHDGSTAAHVYASLWECCSSSAAAHLPSLVGWAGAEPQKLRREKVGAQID